MKKWRVMNGLHSEGGKTYAKGDVVESDKDLSVFGPEKFQEVVEAIDQDSVEALEAEQAKIAARLEELRAKKDAALVDDLPLESDDGLDAMTVGELKKHAEAEGVPLGKAHTKAEIIGAIRFATE